MDSSANGVYMASFDVVSLFTNIPRQETIDICIMSLSSTAIQVLGITAKYFRSLLELAVMNSYFIFNEKFYFQKEGVGMGLPLGPTFANIFMCHYEKLWLASCPPEFAPMFYRPSVHLFTVDFGNIARSLEVVQSISTIRHSAR